MSNEQLKPKRKKWIYVAIGGVISLVLLMLIFSVFTTWAQNGGDVVGVLETSGKLKNMSSIIQALAIVYLWWNWDELVVNNKKSTERSRAALRKGKNSICGFGFFLLLIFWFL
jgi:membrane protein implicated in regulation of membrane protease activity